VPPAILESRDRQEQLEMQDLGAALVPRELQDWTEQRDPKEARENQGDECPASQLHALIITLHLPRVLWVTRATRELLDHPETKDLLDHRDLRDLRDLQE